MNGVGRNVRISILEIHVDHDEIVDVVKVISDLLFSDPAGDTAHDEISRCTSGDLVRDVKRNLELTVGPAKLELYTISIQIKVTLEYY